jgi:hypothetical protein
MTFEDESRDFKSASYVNSLRVAKSPTLALVWGLPKKQNIGLLFWIESERERES